MIQIVAHGIFFPANPMTIFIYKNESLNVDGITVKTINAFYVQHEEKPSCLLDFFLHKEMSFAVTKVLVKVNYSKRNTMEFIMSLFFPTFI